MIHILTTILFVSVLGSLNSLFSYFLDYCFWIGSIFGKWLPFNAKINLKIFEPKIFKELQVMKLEKTYDDMLIDAASQLPFYKITGGCIICTNVWIGFFTFIGIHQLFNISWWYLIPYLLVSSFILRKIAK